MKLSANTATTLLFAFQRVYTTADYVTVDGVTSMFLMRDYIGNV